MSRKKIEIEEHLVNSIQVLLHLGAQINIVVKTVETLEKNKETIDSIEHLLPFVKHESLESISKGYLSSFATILFSSFLDEYNNDLGHVSLSNNTIRRIREVKKQLKPVINRIAKWKDIKRYRNELAAHNYKINKNEQFFAEGRPTREYVIPGTTTEMLLFAELVKKITQTLTTEFDEINYPELLKVKMLDTIQLISFNIDVEAELEEIERQMELIPTTAPTQK